MFLRWKSFHTRNGKRWSAILLRCTRVNGKPRQSYEGTLFVIDEGELTEEKRREIWRDIDILVRDRFRLSEAQYARVKEKITAKIDPPPKSAHEAEYERLVAAMNKLIDKMK
jgi:hypothetical protein